MSTYRTIVLGCAVLLVGGGLAGAVVVARRMDRASYVATAVHTPPPVRRGQRPPLDPPGFVGVIVASQTVDIAAKLEGRIVDVKVKPGQRVSNGSVLAVIDASALFQEIAVAEVAVRAAEERQRRRQAAATNVPGGPLVSAEELSASTHELNAARARLDLVRTQTSEAVVRAPFDGTVGTRYLDKGAYAKPGAPILRLVGSGGLRVRFAVPEERSHSVQPKSIVTFELDAKTYSGEVQSVSPEVDSASNAVTTEATLADVGEDARGSLVGRTVRVRPKEEN